MTLARKEPCECHPYFFSLSRNRERFPFPQERNKMKKIELIILVIIAIILRHQAQKINELTDSIKEEAQEWILISDDTMATVYNAVPSQCNDDVAHTASMYELNLADVLSDRVVAMERTMMKEYGIKYGDIIKIEGAGRWDGVWQVQDTMNKRFAGQHKIDILVPRIIRHGKWEDVKIYIPANENTRETAKKLYKI